MSGFELREIPGLPGYFASTDGRIWSNKEQGRWFHTVALRSIQPALDRSGYPYVSLMGPGTKRGRTFKVHRLIALTFHGPCPDGMQVCHLNHTPMDNRPENLSYGTAKENRRQSIVAGRHRDRRKLTPPQVLEIWARLQGGTSQIALAKEYCMAKQTISSIKFGRSWRHLALVPKQEQG